MTTTDVISLSFSGLALAISIGTTWLTLLRRGTLRVTRPALIFFGPDGAGKGPTKVFMRLFLYSTGDRGRIIEQMYVRLRHAGQVIHFTRWIVRDGSLSRGTGLTVDRNGVASDHHFILSDPDGKHEFAAGEYAVELFATCVGIKKPLLLSSQDVSLSADHANALNYVDVGIFFDWNPELGTYEAVADRNRTAELNAKREQEIRNLIRAHI